VTCKRNSDAYHTHIIDRGSALLTRLSIVYPQYFKGFVWLGLAFWAPEKIPFDLPEVMKQNRESVGYERWAYWEYFVKDSTPEELKNNVSSRYRYGLHIALANLLRNFT